MGKAKAEFSLSGIAGPGRVSKAEEALSAVHGVDYAHVNLGAGKAQVNFDDEVTSVEALQKALTLAGFEAERQ